MQKKLPSRKTLRLQNYDYSSVGAYFVTICTKDKKNFFGKIENEEMLKNTLGEIAEKYWHKIPQYYSNIRLGEFVVMPNHIHGILWIEEKNDSQNKEHVGADIIRPNKNLASAVEINKRSNLSEIIKSYKGVISKNIRKKYPNFSWQKSFHDRVIRDSEELETFTDYIRYNPVNWEKDKHYEAGD